MPHSELEKLWNKGQNLGNLKLIDLSYSYHLAEVPDLSHSQKIRHINLECCASLVQIQSYFQYLDKLTYIHLGSCWNLKRAAIKELPSSVWSNEKIYFLDIEYCEYLEHLPSSSCNLKFCSEFSVMCCSSLGKFFELPREIKLLKLTETAIEVLPSSIECLYGLKTIELRECKRFVSLPTSICKLKSLEKLDLSGCCEFEHFPEILEPMGRLEFLSLQGMAVKELPSSIEYLSGLNKIQLKGCRRLVSLPMSICKLKCLKILDLNSCSEFECFPEILEPMEDPLLLSLEGTSVIELPSLTQNLSGIKD
ncbi:disease resistance protein TAO1-like [Prunus avium]|uniref:Disease resistance protein TAO1-like n=1 Tax=Prunus avium TaxID=42229 RepID=A0A6P5SDX7_PRUAV|nr:disease resistance protein TAO1-like [Prunus avium]XP_021812053.1 disease resistance protein TAO1-like [Prunus avium]XP_021812054.1 disease resistance protein TAO1-like [Prunus avium]XP_021812055.1 disease resistance protein TAO1-like [Prunus avium]XP_021812056.1 disease resistance protein TAO1-like [Prunus avium]